MGAEGGDSAGHEEGADEDISTWATEVGSKVAFEDSDNGLCIHEIEEFGLKKGGVRSGCVHGLTIEPTVEGWFFLQFIRGAVEYETTLVDQNNAVGYLRDLLKNVSRQ